jgi:hypothetical protein
MTDEEIIEVVNFCQSSKACSAECPFWGRAMSGSKGGECDKRLGRVAFDFIHRLLAENGSLRNEVESVKAQNATLCERLEAVELPCKLGDTVYEIIDGEIRETEVIQLQIDSIGLWITTRMDFGVSTVLFNKVARIYLTREAAETRLTQLKGGEK